ncbi:hypothetical protein COLO4_20511 [Corchorus olitorius]|uniref:Uncharacterized protein n=1 Tax=Corchorus olitorius TaxID=93759 RepID=A0A1R3IZK0_9ROSI|nr:hypothetical protein COLO4_20511 [Corchorus olitorius]
MEDDTDSGDRVPVGLDGVRVVESGSCSVGGDC